MDVGKSFGYVFDDDRWITKILIAAAILALGLLFSWMLLIPLILAGLLLGGYGIEITRRLDQALGHEPEPVSPARPENRFAVRLTLPDPIGLPEEYGIYGGIFADVGTLWSLDDTAGASGSVRGGRPGREHQGLQDVCPCIST